jgi:MinD-like ATPase involved in chromosome partitioning or flagellar assembly
MPRIKNYIPYATHFREAVIKRTPISFYKPKAEAGKSIQRIADELDARIAAMTDARRVA